MLIQLDSYLAIKLSFRLPNDTLANPCGFHLLYAEAIPHSVLDFSFDCNILFATALVCWEPTLLNLSLKVSGALPHSQLLMNLQLIKSVLSATFRHLRLLNSLSVWALYLLSVAARIAHFCNFVNEDSSCVLLIEFLHAIAA